MSRPVIRPARPSDLPGILAVEHAAFSDPWSAESFEPEFTDPYSFFRVADLNGVVAGYVVARIVARQGEIANIAVAPAMRGTGIGGQLLDAAVAAAEAAECEAVWLEVRASNAPAQRLYASRGFLLVGRRKRYYRLPVEDALVLRREPASAGANAPK